MPRSTNGTAQVREHFRRKAFSFDHLYDEEHALQRLLRPGLFNRRELAVSIVREHDAPSVLDVGGGSGRVGEFVLDAGASRYVDADIADTMLDLARTRLERFGDKVQLVKGDFLEAELEGPFDVVLALGYFDYIEDAPAHVRRISELCSGTAVASFPRWTWTKGPIRKVRYEVINRCPIFDYTEPQLRELFSDFAKVDVQAGRSGFLVRADR
jgi:ubiquinone/menaquinone biosynthesis C-methylase UbiE